ncbi:helix-turn-helix domain-containing protein [Nocardioides rotundus]|uniref:arsenate reductase/protein-tyrosine-phosphatase family protein n=1 Tax=Nocardioides rotundus TaxID=1774216 RepID=UPI001CBEF294|nr:helix-turn-helix domain-containing protein [Nocardioides rotundus]UAL29867.1 helix-turn-helix domain-containing protein [Nocardioides rotundus]
MSVEILSDGGVEERVRVFAALAEPVRLRIVDLVAFGDAAPSELQRHLAISSNLMAHHLGVLTDAGLVARRRSEADRRRSYLQLLPAAVPLLAAALTQPAQTQLRGARRVVFVCTANSARSQLAAALWARASDVPVTSAGTHPAARVAPGAARTARKHGLTLLGDRPQQLDEVTGPDDYVIAVCDNAYEELPAGTTDLHWSVPDPVRVGTAGAFDAAHDDLAARVAHLAPHLSPN